MTRDTSVITMDKEGLMKPGRELDALIAEKVMGIKNPTPQQNSFGLQVHEEIPRYSTDIALAWKVIKNIKQLPWDRNNPNDSGVEVRLTWCTANKNWECFIWNEQMIRATARTAPHAICLAALKAHDVSVPDAASP